MYYWRSDYKRDRPGLGRRLSHKRRRNWTPK